MATLTSIFIKLYPQRWFNIDIRWKPLSFYHTCWMKWMLMCDFACAWYSPLDGKRQVLHLWVLLFDFFGEVDDDFLKLRDQSGLSQADVLVECCCLFMPGRMSVFIMTSTFLFPPNTNCTELRVKLSTSTISSAINVRPMTNNTLNALWNLVKTKVKIQLYNCRYLKNWTPKHLLYGIAHFKFKHLSLTHVETGRIDMKSDSRCHWACEFRTAVPLRAFWFLCVLWRQNSSHYVAP